VHHEVDLVVPIDRPRAIMTPELYHPVWDCFMRALPFHYRSMSASAGTAVGIDVSGECGGDWHLYRGDAWMLASEPVGAIVTTVTIPQDIAWRIFTKGIAREHASEHVRVTGDATLGNHILDMLAIVGVSFPTSLAPSARPSSSPASQ
jgi:hypothetical protein